MHLQFREGNIKVWFNFEQSRAESCLLVAAGILSALYCRDNKYRVPTVKKHLEVQRLKMSD